MIDDPSKEDASLEPAESVESVEAPEGRPLIERVGLALIALALGAMFGGVGYAAWLGGELFLAGIGAISCLMTWWVGALTLVRR